MKNEGKTITEQRNYVLFESRMKLKIGFLVGI